MLPRIDQVDPGFVEVFGVAPGLGRAAILADGGYLGIEPVNGQAEAVAPGDDCGIPDYGVGIEGLDEFAERGEYLGGGSQQAVLPAPVRQPFEAVAHLADGYRRDA
jgi:hypothetical protein